MIRPSEDLALYDADMAAWDSAERGEPGWRASRRDVDREIKDLAHWLELDLELPG
jgi:hypothetical protein